MTTAGTHTLLAAIKVLFSGRQLAVARHQLRLVVGYLKALAKVWSQGRRNLEEIQAIAKEVLSRKMEPRQPRTALDNTSQRSQPADKEPCMEGLESWSSTVMTLESQDCLEPYWSPSLNNEFQPDISIWFSNY
jgi:hypothetical protein